MTDIISSPSPHHNHRQSNRSPPKPSQNTINEKETTTTTTTFALHSSQHFLPLPSSLPVYTMVPPPRSVADATRFTPTGPHAFTRTPIPAAATTAAGETPQQRVARLKAAQRARLDQISTVDKVIARGRVWADKAHRAFALSLIGATSLFFSPFFVRRMNGCDREGDV